MKGYRTYIIAVLIGVASAAKYLGYLDETTFQMITGLLVGGGFATLRAAVPPTE